MTAEITMLNRSAIVLAADSAVTILDSQGQKVYHSANKLFMLSKYHPVGIMIYQNSDFMGVPWETIIKFYRKKLKQKELPRLKDYVEDFKKFLCEDRALLPEDLQTTIFAEVTKNRLIALREKIRIDFKTASEERLKAKQPSFTGDELKQLFATTIDGVLDISGKWGILPCFAAADKHDLITKYDKVLSDSIKDEFQAAPLNDHLNQKIKEVVINYVISNQFASYSGIVISGFGKDDIFPCYIHLWAEFIFENKLKCYEWPCKNATDQTLEFFAQSDKGTAFVTGIDPDLYAHAEKKFVEFKQKITNEIESKLLSGLDVAKLDAAKKVLQDLIANAEKEYTDSIQEYIRDWKVAPIARTIGVLSKDELALAAESLVSLTSFKKRVSGEPETVGGPVDVAVISKGDGFIWMKRKHYFDPKLNSHFLKNYYQGDDHDNG